MIYQIIVLAGIIILNATIAMEKGNVPLIVANPNETQKVNQSKNAHIQRFLLRCHSCGELTRSNADPRDSEKTEVAMVDAWLKKQEERKKKKEKTSAVVVDVITMPEDANENS